ncbi:MAG TPA: response regulator, partial [Bdellovibrionales bacterium]|nr:response regulator [Bdellovibrionales bacterium]
MFNSPPIRQAKVLLVDDREENLLAFEVALRSVGCELIKVTSGKAALQILETTEVAAVVLDVQMPDMDGFEVATRIRSKLETRELPILFVTALDRDSRYIEQAYELGATDFVTKPLNAKVLAAKIRFFVDLFHKNKQLHEQAQLIANSSEERMRMMISTSPSFMCLISGPNHVFEQANDRYLELIGRDDILGKPILEVLPEIAKQGFVTMLDGVRSTGEPIKGAEVPVTLQRAGTTETRFVDFVYQPDTLVTGKVERIFVHGVDVTDKVRKRSSVENERANFRNLFKQTPEMVCILKGPDHIFEFVNEAHIKALGFDATGMKVRDAQPESVEVHGILDDVYRTGNTAELFEIPITLTDRLRYFNLTYAARKDDDGRINGVMILGIEVTDQVIARHDLLENQRRYQLLFEYSPLPKWMVDIETLQFIDVNQAAIEHYGYSKDEFLSMNAAEIKVAEDLESSKNSRHRKKDGTIIDVEVSALDIIVSGRKARIAAIVDVTDRRRAEQKQKELLTNLNATKEEAERANHLKSAFLANMSHEIRTPLGAMIGFADLLRDPGLTINERSNYVDILARNGESLSVIINDILDLSKVEAGHMTLELTDASPSEIAEDVVSLLRVKAKEKGLVFEFNQDSSTPQSIVSDPTRIRQILLNIAGNAIKFTQFGSVKVRSFGCESANGRRAVCFEVTDTGIGIPESQIENIFEMFVQADGSMTRRFGGTGLGLALSRSLARSLGGEVSITRTGLGKGSTFLITIEDHPERRNSTAVPSPKERSATTGAPTVSLEGLKVLVVDDSADNRQLIWHLLNKRGALIDTAENGLLGYRKALAGNFDVVLMDIQMPEMDGYTATHKLRTAGYQKPIIALTAHAMSEVRQKCLNVGCSD